jgi:prevent-host-death family protein
MARSSRDDQAMVPVKISELKDRFSHYLREVRRGGSVLVSDRGRVIARIEPVGGATPADGDDASWISRLDDAAPSGAPGARSPPTGSSADRR